MKRQIVIVGAGASGLTAAIAAAKTGADVLVLEKMDKAGKKILATGNGKCNYTNYHMNPQCYRSSDLQLLEKVLEQYDTEKIVDFFKELGVWPKEKAGYVYPNSQQAASILEVLLAELKRLHVELALSETVQDIKKQGKLFKITTNQRKIDCAQVILATGGKAAKKLGSDGSGYSIAKSMGHHMIVPLPALTGLKCQGRFFKAIAGVRTHATVTLYATESGQGKDVTKIKLAEDTGELQLTAYGISGIPVFQVSRFAAEALMEGRQVSAEIDFMPEISDEMMETMMLERMKRLGYKTAEESLVGLVNQKLIHLFLTASAIDDDALAGTLETEKIIRLAQRMKYFQLRVAETNNFDEAQVCAGGVDTTEIDAETMMSKKVEGLYMTGELLDVDGMCGGYNLHFAWATGLIAGNAAGLRFGGKIR